jgi:hypothetical protein
MLGMSILDDIKICKTHPIDCTCESCQRAMKVIGEVRGVLRTESPPPKFADEELRRPGQRTRKR